MRNKLVPNIIILLVSISTGFSQITAPVSVTTVLTPPYSPFLSDYISIGSNNLVTTLIFNDLTEPSWNVRLRITIESSQIRISTRPDFRPPVPITVQPGILVYISGKDLEPYLNYNNVIIEGTTIQELQKNGKLPQGYYTFCVEVYDYNSGRLLSNKSCTGAMLQLNDVPLILSPVTGEVVKITGSMNIPFQWQLSSPAYDTRPGSTEFQFTLYKIIDPDVSPVDAIANKVVEKIYESEFSPNTMLVYGLSHPPLETGQKYAFQVQARDAYGKDNFKNNGYSKVGWFYYGYPTGGNVQLISPVNDKNFTKDEYKRLRWGAPDNANAAGQQVYYHIKIVEISEAQDPREAVKSNIAWYEETTSPRIASGGGDIILNKEPEPLRNYAWQVTAYTGEQEIAKSDAFKFTGPPLIEWFWAGNHKVIVTKTNNNNLNSLSGKGKITSPVDNKTYEFSFDSLQISESGGEYVLRNGNLYSQLSGFQPIELIPDNINNESAYFYSEMFRLNKDGLAVKGIVKWDFPLATASSELQKVVSKPGWLNYDSFKLLGSVSLGNKNKFTLIDPAGFDIVFDSLSNFQVSDNKFKLRFFGHIVMPEKVKDINLQRMILPFRNIDNLFYFTQQDVRLPVNILAVPNTSIQLKPVDYTVDFSESQAIAGMNSNPVWKGVYVSRFMIGMKTLVDQSGLLKLDNEITTSIVSEGPISNKCSVDPDGLDLKVEIQLNEFNRALYNSFRTEITTLSLDVDNSDIKESFIKATMKIPVLVRDEVLNYVIPLSRDGLQTSNVGGLLANRKVMFNADKEKLKVEVTLKQAVFRDNERLEMVVDIDWPAIQAFASGIQGLCVWGNEDFGFAVPNGKKALSRQFSGKYYGTYDITIDSVMAGKTGNKYLVGFSGNIILSDDISGKNNTPPRVNLASFQAVDNVTSNYELGSVSWVQQYVTSAGDYANPGDIYADLPYIRISTPVIEFEGGLVATNDHPEWGTAFYGLMDAKIKQPAEYKAKIQFLLGKQDGISYWFGEIGVGTSGHEPDEVKVPEGNRKKMKKVAMTKTGLKLGALEITGITGRVYRHMRPQTAVGVDCNMEFDEIAEPGLKEYNASFSIPDLPDADICTILNHLNVEQIKQLLCKLNQSAFEAVLEQLPEPDFDDIQQYIASHGPADSEFLNQMIAAEARSRIEQGYTDNVQEKYHAFAYAQLAKVFPGYDWCQKVIEDNKQGIQWGDILCRMPDLRWPSVPNLPNLPDYLFNRVLVSLPIPDFADLEAVLPDIDWAKIKLEYPSITWPEIQVQFPDLDIRRILMIFPHINWREIYLKVPQLPKLEWPDWRKYLPELPDLPEITLEIPEIKVSMPSMSFEPGEIDVDYKVDASVSYGSYLLIDYHDFAQQGQVVEGTGTMEIVFTSSGSLDNIGMQVTSNWGNYFNNPPVVEGLGCMTYNPSDERFIGDFFGQSRNPAICGHGKLHIDISSNTFNVNLASKEKPVVLQPLCSQGHVRLTGYFSLNPNTFNVGLGALMRYGFKGSVSTKVCDLGIKAEASLRADIFASINYRPEIVVNEASFHVSFNASLDVTTGGTLCNFGDFTVASVGLSGDLRYMNQSRQIRGKVSGHASFLSIITCDFDLSTEFNL